MTKERHLEEAHRRLLPLLGYHGYHQEKPGKSHLDIVRTSWGLCERIWEESVEPVDCEKEKPFRLLNMGNRLEILHGECTGWKPGTYYAHCQQFLKAMIPVIGRLDAKAHYDPGCPGISPRLRIYL